MPDKLIYLIRHAQPDYPGGKMMCLGQKSDLPLSAAGFSQAEALARYFDALPIEAVYTSPLLRARQTAEALAGARPVFVLHDLIEMHGGEWDGLTFDELRARYPLHFGKGRQLSCPPGGESDESGLGRIRAALAHIARQTERCAAVVAHSGLNRLLLCELTGQPFHEKKRVPQDCACVNVLRLSGGAWSAEAINLLPPGVMKL